MELLIEQLAALAHKDRLALFRLLVRRCPDFMPAGEITETLGLKPSTTSAHLAALHRCGLTKQKRVGTSVQYQLNAEGAQSLVTMLFSDCCRGRPDLCPPALSQDLSGRSTGRDDKQNILFVCTGNSARSIFAEAILNDIAPDRFNVFSAGTQPFSTINPLAVETLQNKGIDTARLHAKTISQYQGADAPRMDFVFTVCDQAANVDFPVFPGQPMSAHWGLPDPVQIDGSDVEKRRAFQRTFGVIHNRLSTFAALPFATLDRPALQQNLDKIAQDTTSR